MVEEMKKIEPFLSENDRAIIDQVENIFREADKAAEGFKKVAGIHCPDMCGICCATAEVDATVAEMLPLAVELWRQDKANAWLDLLDKVKEQGMCIFFKEDPDAPGNGRCLIYGLRPLICRMFGFFIIRDKNGKCAYGGCKIIKERYPEDYKKAVNLITEDTNPSYITDYSIRITGMANEWSRKSVPINTAAKTAIEKVGFEIKKRNFFCSNNV